MAAAATMTGAPYTTPLHQHYRCSSPLPTMSPLAPSHPSPGAGATCGMKRKLEELEDSSYSDQRQSILNISMCKLRSPAPATSSSGGTRKAEPSLRRSVLIFNTLRHIENELAHEGVPVNPASKLPTIPPPGTPTTDIDLDPLPSAAAPAPIVTAPQPQCSLSSTSSELSHVSSMEVSSSSPQQQSSSPLPCRTPEPSAPAPSPPSSPTSPLSEQFLQDTKYLFDSLLSSDKLTVTSFTQLFDLDSNTTTTTTSSSSASLSMNMPSSTASNWSYPPSLSSSTSSNSSSYSSSTTSLPSLSDFMSTSLGTYPSSYPPQRESDILADLDSPAVFESDLFCPPFSPKLQPLNAEDLIHTLPPMSSVETFPNSCGNSSTWGHKSELLNDDLDHIMQILVGM